MAYSRYGLAALGRLALIVTLLGVQGVTGVRAQTAGVLFPPSWVCNELEELKELISRQEPPEGCGSITQAVPAMAQFVEDFTHGKLIYSLFAFTIMVDGKTAIQYGFMGVKDKPLDV